MNFDYSLSLKLFFEQGFNEIILGAIKPDLERKYDRSKIQVNEEKDSLNLEVKAADLTALRASYNSILKNIILSKELIESHRRR